MSSLFWQFTFEDQMNISSFVAIFTHYCAYSYVVFALNTSERFIFIYQRDQGTNCHRNGGGTMTEKIEFLSAILLVSKDPERLARFYKDIVGLPLEDEQHGETEKHYGCELGDLHFAIHPAKNFEGTAVGTGSVKMAFAVFDMKAFVEKVKAAGHKLAYEPTERGFATMTAMTDPDGNYIEFTQLSDRWFKHIESRRKEGHDILNRWQTLKK